MQRIWTGLCLALSLSFIQAAEKRFDFPTSAVNTTPAGFRSLVTGEGKPGEWKVVLDEVPPMLAPLSPNAPVVTRRPVLAQLSKDPTDEHFPLFVYDEEVFGDFTLTTKVKTVEGKEERMAGIAFRIQDEKNYYVIRISSLGNSLRFYKVTDGKRTPPLGPEMSLPSGKWHELKIEVVGRVIRCFLNGKQAMPDLNDSSFATGKIGFWTKSDSVSYFAETVINYKPRIPYAQTLVQRVISKNPRLLDLQVFAQDPEKKQLNLIAAHSNKALGKQGGQVEMNVMERGLIYYGKDTDKAIVTFPLRDQNGETVAAVRIEMESFPGQTEKNAVARALPIIKEMEAHVRTAKDLFE